MPPTPSKRGRRDRQTEQQIVRDVATELSLPDLKPVDLNSPKLQNLKDNLTTARKRLHDLEIQDADMRHQLAQDWDALLPRSGINLDRHNELAMSHHQWYRDLRNIYKQRIRKLEMDIATESNNSNWRNWAPAELLARWKFGLMDYSVFKDPEATALVREACKLEVGLQVPKETVIALVSTQVAAGWYKTPTESVDWLHRKLDPSYIDKDWPATDDTDRSVYVPGYTLRNTFVLDKKPKQSIEGTHLPRVRPSMHKRKLAQAAWEEQMKRDVYKNESARMTRFNRAPSYDHVPEYRQSWAHKYPIKDYSDGEIEDIIRRANYPDKPKKWVNMIAGRTSTRMVIADEYVE